MMTPSKFWYAFFQLLVFMGTLFCFPDNEDEIDVAFPDELKPQSRLKRAMSSKAFKAMQGNWKFSKKEIEAMFEEYYACITEANKEENRLHDPITAVLALEGQRIELECPTCQRPDQASKFYSMFWQRVRVSDASTVHIHPNTPGIKIKKDMSLMIAHVDVKDAGQYFCILDRNPAVIYQLDVVFKEPARTVSENNTDELLPSQRLVDHNLEVYSHWSGWGECDRCNSSGMRLKFGTCMIQKIDKSKPTNPVNVPIMTTYPDGVPCRSTVLPRPIANLPGIHGRKSEIIKGYCSQPCPTKPPPIEVTDKDGNVVDVIEGGYHPLGQKPDLPSMVVRKVFYKALGSTVVLACPTSKKGKVRWQRGDRPIDMAGIRSQTRGRVIIDRLNRLVIRRLRKGDGALYSCWVWQRLVATTKIITFQPMNNNLKNYITYGGLALTMLAIPIMCICKIFCGKFKRQK